MAVVLKDFRIPNRCVECLFLNGDGDYPRCEITEETKGYNFDIYTFRMANCPLIDVDDEVLLPTMIKKLYNTLPEQFDFVINSLARKKTTTEEILKYAPKR